MPCKDPNSGKEKEPRDNASPATNHGQLLSVVRVIQPSEIPALIDNGNDSPGDHGGGHDTPTTFWYITPDNGETGEERHAEPTFTVTAGMERVTFTMAPSTLAVLPGVATQVETVTTTVTATVTPLDQFCTSIGVAAGVPIACIVGTSAFMVGMYMWFHLRNDRNETIRRETVAALNGYSDGSTDGSTTPLAAPRLIRGGGGGSSGGLRSGIMAPPSSIASQPGGPFADPAPHYGRVPAPRVPQESANDSQGIHSQRASYVSNYSNDMPSGSNTDRVASRRNSLATTLTDRASSNGEIQRAEHASTIRNNSRAVTSQSGPVGRFSADGLLPGRFQVTFNEIGNMGVAIPPVPATPRRPIAAICRARARHHASATEASEDEGQISNIPPASAVLVTQDSAHVAKLEGSPVPRRFSAAARANDEGRVRTSSDESGVHTMDRDFPFELSADKPIHELGIKDAIAAPANTEQDRKDGNMENGAQNGGSEDNSKDGDKTGQRAESPIKQ